MVTREAEREERGDARMSADVRTEPIVSAGFPGETPEYGVAA
jgi:hypothetical protein